MTDDSTHTEQLHDRLLASAPDLIDRYLRDSDIAFFRHPARDCIYDEAAFCIDHQLDEPEVIAAQDAAVAVHTGSSRQHESSMQRIVRSRGTISPLTFFCSDIRFTRKWPSRRYTQ